MFNKSKGKGTTVVAAGASFEGTLELQGDAHIEGKFVGSVTSAGDVSVGPEGSVLGTLTANVLTIAGRAEGTIVARSALRVLRSGKAEGRLYYESLHVEAGGVVTGEVRNGSPPAPARAASDQANESDPADEPSHVSSVAPLPPAPVVRSSTPLQVAAER